MRANKIHQVAFILIIKDRKKKIFGAFCDEPLQKRTGFYGHTETFVFEFNPELQIYKKGKGPKANHFYIKSTENNIAIGFNDIAIWMSGDITRGVT
ncbi:MAG: hypothetical protein EZS28_054798, partial [Streblomastix strix]